jgi:glucokinase
MAVIGLDLGGTKLSGAIFLHDGTIVRKVVLPLKKRGGEDAGRFVTKLIANLLELAAGMSIKIDATGISVPGIAYPETGMVWAPNISGWDNYPLLDQIKSGIPDKTIK